jgi:GAF domain-containing protein
MILRKKKWSEDEINILQTLARNITSSIERIKEKKPFMKVKRNSVY